MPDIVEACQRMADQGKRVIVAGLDKDYRGDPFEPIPALMAVAEDVTKTLAICVRCGSPANNTQRLVESDERVVVGAQGIYEARCRRCFEPPDKKEAGSAPVEIVNFQWGRPQKEFSEGPAENPVEMPVERLEKRRNRAVPSGLHRVLCEPITLPPSVT